jgi:hypothetical protein
LLLLPKTVIFNKGQADETTILNDNLVFVYNFSARNELTVSFADWNDINFVRFTGLFVGLTAAYDRRSGLVDLFRGSESIADNIPPTNGVLGQYGSFQALDINGVIRELEELNMITPEVRATLLSRDIVISKYLFQKWNYSRVENNLIADFRDAVDKWHDIIVEKQPLIENATALDFYNLLKTFDAEIEYADLPDEMHDYLNGIQIQYLYLEESNLGAAWNKFAEEAKVYVVIDKEGKVDIEVETTN